MNSPYISRVQTENFRNFKEVDVNLNHQQVIIGENNVGKTNLLRAIVNIVKFCDLLITYFTRQIC
ncbi:MAG: AAA family ATPase, partial [Bacteroidota bacterium]